MTDRASGVLQALGKMIDGAHLAPPHRLPAVINEALQVAGWHATVYLADFDQRMLRPVGEDRQPESIDGTLAGRCFRHSSPANARRPEPHTWVPLIDGVDRLGVLRFELPADLDIDDPEVAAHVRWVAHLIGHLV